MLAVAWLGQVCVGWEAQSSHSLQLSSTSMCGGGVMWCAASVLLTLRLTLAMTLTPTQHMLDVLHSSCKLLSMSPGNSSTTGNYPSTHPHPCTQGALTRSYRVATTLAMKLFSITVIHASDYLSLTQCVFL